MCLLKRSRSAWRLPEASNAQTTRVFPFSSRRRISIAIRSTAPLDVLDVLGPAPLDRDRLPEHRRRRHGDLARPLHVKLGERDRSPRGVGRRGDGRRLNRPGGVGDQGAERRRDRGRGGRDDLLGLVQLLNLDLGELGQLRVPDLGRERRRFLITLRREPYDAEHDDQDQVNAKAHAIGRELKVKPPPHPLRDRREALIQPQEQFTHESSSPARPASSMIPRLSPESARMDSVIQS